MAETIKSARTEVKDMRDIIRALQQLDRRISESGPPGPPGVQYFLDLLDTPTNYHVPSTTIPPVTRLVGIVETGGPQDSPLDGQVVFVDPADIGGPNGGETECVSTDFSQAVDNNYCFNVGNSSYIGSDTACDAPAAWFGYFDSNNDTCFPLDSLYYEQFAPNGLNQIGPVLAWTGFVSGGLRFWYQGTFADEFLTPRDYMFWQWTVNNFGRHQARWMVMIDQFNAQNSESTQSSFILTEATFQVGGGNFSIPASYSELRLAYRGGDNGQLPQTLGHIALQGPDAHADSGTPWAIRFPLSSGTAGQALIVDSIVIENEGNNDYERTIHNLAWAGISGMGTLDDLFAGSALGDLIVHDGIAWDILSVGADNAMIRANSGAGLGIEWFDLFGSSNTWTVSQDFIAWTMGNWTMSLDGDNLLLSSSDTDDVFEIENGMDLSGAGLFSSVTRAVVNCTYSTFDLNSGTDLVSAIQTWTGQFDTTGPRALYGWSCALGTAGSVDTASAQSGAIVGVRSNITLGDESATYSGVIYGIASNVTYSETSNPASNIVCYGAQTNSITNATQASFFRAKAPSVTGTVGAYYSLYLEEITDLQVTNAYEAFFAGAAAAYFRSANNYVTSLSTSRLNVHGDTDVWLYTASETPAPVLGTYNFAATTRAFIAADVIHLQGAVIGASPLTFRTNDQGVSVETYKFYGPANDPGADGDESLHGYYMRQDDSTSAEFCRMTITTVDADNTSKDGSITWSSMLADSMTDALTVAGDAVTLTPGGSAEVTVTANLMTFANGATTTALDWQNSGVLDFYVGSTKQMSLGPNALILRSGGTEPSLNWATTSMLRISNATDTIDYDAANHTWTHNINPGLNATHFSVSGTDSAKGGSSTRYFECNVNQTWNDSYSIAPVLYRFALDDDRTLTSGSGSETVFQIEADYSGLTVSGATDYSTQYVVDVVVNYTPDIAFLLAECHALRVRGEISPTFDYPVACPVTAYGLDFDLDIAPTNANAAGTAVNYYGIGVVGSITQTQAGAWNIYTYRVQPTVTQAVGTMNLYGLYYAPNVSGSPGLYPVWWNKGFLKGAADDIGLELGAAGDYTLLWDGGSAVYDVASGGDHAFAVNGTEQLRVTDGTFEPITDNDVDLGTSSKYFKDAYLKGRMYFADYCSVTTTADSTASSAEYSVFDEDNYSAFGSDANVTARNITFTSTDGRFTVTNAGIYVIQVTLLLMGASTTLCDLTVKVDGSDVYDYPAIVHSAVDPPTRTIMIMQDLSASSYVEVYVDGATANVTCNAGCTINMWRIS